MKSKYKNTVWIFLVSIGIGLPLSSLALIPGEGIIKNENGDYLITYMSPDMGKLIQVTYVPPNKVSPTVTSSFSIFPNWAISYRYQVYNQGKQTDQPITGFSIDSISSIVLDQTQPQGWPKLERHAEWLKTIDPSEQGGYLVIWELKGIPVNQRQTGLNFVSIDLPGVGAAEIDGDGKIPSFMGEPNKDIVAMYDKLVKETSFVPRNAAVPTITVPTTFDAAVLLDRIRTHFLTWQGKQLIEPAFASQLDRYLVAAAEAFRRNQIKAGKEHLETIHELLEKEHKHLDGDDDDEVEKQDKEHRTANRPNIDRLAARVLDFDLKYVLKRLEPLEDSRKKETQDNR